MREESLLLEDIHPYWRFNRIARMAAENPYLPVQELEVVRPRGLPPGAKNVNRREQVFDTSTNRNPSLLNGLKRRLSTK